ncbi:hypothetical protein C2S52_003137 [Perilla frutescens var. hirtella]|nr:hypothetical protein C2S52_003137 [Perilla frutescens var. hirtella]
MWFTSPMWFGGRGGGWGGLRKKKSCPLFFFFSRDWCCRKKGYVAGKNGVFSLRVTSVARRLRAQPPLDAQAQRVSPYRAQAMSAVASNVQAQGASPIGRATPIFRTVGHIYGSGTTRNYLPPLYESSHRRANSFNAPAACTCPCTQLQMRISCAQLQFAGLPLPCFLSPSPAGNDPPSPLFICTREGIL